MKLQRLTLLCSGICLAAAGLEAEPLRVCADPAYLPFSNSAGEGFENRIAVLVASALGRTVEYTWASTRGHGGFPQFLSSTLDAKKCDVVMDIPYASREELTTRPYYISSYVFVFDSARKYDISSMDSPLLKRLKVGFERETPVEDALKMRGMVPGAQGFEIATDDGQSPARMLEALKNGTIDVLITWQPAIGAFLRSFPNLEAVPVPNDRTLGPPEQFAFPMAMGVRFGDDALKNSLDSVIESHQAELGAILAECGVMSLARREDRRN